MNTAIESKEAGGTIESIVNSIDSALKEQNAIISTSYEIFNGVLKQSVIAKRSDDGEKDCSDCSNLANVLSEIRDSIVDSNNRLLDFNHRCDL